MTGGKRGDRGTPKDLDLWREVTRQVRPLPGRRPVSAVASTPLPNADKASPETKKKILASRLKRETEIRGTKIELRHGTSEGLDKRQGARLRKGLLPIEGRLDLHGLHLDPAQRALERFLAEAQTQGKRCVLVITGKGRDRGGALRREVPLWLNRPGLRAMVVSFTYAQPKDGGEGALYVLLKRRRADRDAGA
ncbi:MAG TPA: Smr/MutS family protein [Kiloniellaceae bacterium]|nr:Smr/MutS family protein [Kiloniellaceae bacterium]